eukprot:5231051-Lingulodinium_polyedra.AAC.1
MRHPPRHSPPPVHTPLHGDRALGHPTLCNRAPPLPPCLFALPPGGPPRAQPTPLGMSPATS